MVVKGRLGRMKQALISFGWLFVMWPDLEAAEWPNWRGPGFDGITSEELPTNLPKKLPIAWRAEVGTGFSSFSVVGNRVLTMGNRKDKDTVWCLKAETGEVIWKHTYDCELDPLYYEGGPGGTPTVHEGSVYTLSKKGHAYRLDLETGAVIWSRDLLKDHKLDLPEWSFAGSPFVDGERILLNAGRGGIALSRENGETLWLPSKETSGYATIVPFQRKDTVDHLLFSAKSLIGLDSSTGKENWSYRWDCSRDVNAADPIVAGERIILSNSNGTICLSFPDGASEPEKTWEQRDMRWYFNPGVLLDGYLYSLHGTTHRPTELMCTDAETGEIVWTEEGFGSGGIVATKKNVIVFDLGTLTIFPADPGGYQPVLRQEVLEGKCWTAPVFANGRIYCRNAEGDVAAVSVGE